MKRISVVTGAASGIGKATRELLESRGEKVVGVDIHSADVVADLAVPDGREAMVRRVSELTGGQIDAVYAIAGLAKPVPAAVGVNYFGAIATLEGLRPLLAASEAPRAMAVTSLANHGVDDELVELMRIHDEQGALARAAELAANGTGNPYTSSKKALAQWIRRAAPTPQWAGGSIPLNAVAPGIIATPMTTGLTATDEDRAAMLALHPMPLNGIAEPVVVARLLAWLGSDENTHLAGQVVYVDGGAEALLRGDSTW